MIFTDRIITVRKGESKINEPIIVYRGDYELEVRFVIMNSKFKFMSGTNLIESENAAYGQLAILTPYGGNIFSEVAKCNDGTVTFVLTKEMLDQIEEVGLYSFQIRLFDYNKESRVSIPPVEFGIEVREPIISEDHDNSVNNAIVGYSIAKIADALNEEVPDTFNSNGDYNKTIWETGDRITEGKLNKIEDALDKINQNEKNDVAALDKRVTNNFNVLDANKADKNEIFSMKNMGQDIKEAMTGGSVAVVGKDTILTENIVDGQVTYNKTDFLELDTSSNLFDGNYQNIQLMGSSTLQVKLNATGARTALVEIKPNTTYSIIKNKTSRFNFGTATRILNHNEFLDGSVVRALGNSEQIYSTFTTGENDKYLYVNVTMDDEDIFTQIVEGYQVKLTADKYLVKFTEEVNVYTKRDVDYLLNNIEIRPEDIPLVQPNVENIAKDKIIFTGRRITGDDSSYYINSANVNSAVAMVNIQPNTQYSIILEGTDLLDNGKSYFKMFTSSEEYNPTLDKWNSGHNLYYQVTNSLTHIFVSGENDRYLYLYYTDNNIYHDFVVCEGSHSSFYYVPNDKLSVYSKDETDSLIIPRERVDFVKVDHSLNLWDGILYKNRRIIGSSPNISIVSSSASDLYVVKLKPNTKYSVLVKDTNLIYQDRKYIKAFISDILYDENYTGAITYIDYRQPYVNLNALFTTGNDKEEYYLYMYLFDRNIENPVYQVVEGHTTIMSIDSMDDIYVFDGVSAYAKHEVYNKDEIDSILAGASKGNKFIKQGEICSITMNDKVGYTLEHKTTSTINLDTWMLTSGRVNGITIWSDTDIEAPIKELGAEDFIGGVHGDEKFESVTILCDGNIINMSEDYNTSFSNLTVFVKSTLYRCNTSTPVFTRYKKLEFTNTELIVSNRLVCLVDDFVVNRHTGCGLYSIYKDIMTGYTVNTIPELKTSGSVAKSNKIDIGSFYGDGYVITLKVLSGKTDAYGGSVADFASESRPRFKLYFDCISSSDGYPLTLNGELITSFSIDIK